MATEFIVNDSAKDDIMEIVDWYDNKQPGLGNRFYKELLNELEKIKQAPKIYSFYNNDFRRAILKNFPYLIIFKITEEEIVIYSVIYGGRNPRLINRRIN